jgi:hypothetical protein
MTMSETTNVTPEGSGELTVGGAAEAFLGLMGDEEGSEQEQPESHAEAEEGEESEESYEEEAEQEESYDEPEEPLYRVKAAGEEKEVSLSELIKNYQLGADYTKKSQTVAEERRTVEAEKAAVNEAKQLRDTYAQRLQYIEQMLDAQQPQEDLDYLKETDPIGYAVKVAEMSQREKQLAQVRAERQSIQAQQEQDRQQQLRQTVAQEAQKLIEKLPEYADPEKGEHIRQEIRKYGKQAGFSDEELAGVYDSRAVLTLWKAMQFDKLQSARPEISKKVNSAPKMMKPGASQPRESNSEEIRRLKANAKSSGKMRDAAAVFERFL